MRHGCRAALILAIGCNAGPPAAAPPSDPVTGPAVPEQPEPWSDAWILAEGARFLDDPAFRRAALEASLTNHDNAYSRHRLTSYALDTHGWDRLPVWNPRSVPVTNAIAEQLRDDRIPAIPVERAPLWDGVRPTTMAGWVALGRRVFFEFPMRAEVFMEYGLTRPELAEAVGVQRTADGAVPGLVVFANVDGDTRVGITCAICHTAVRDGALIVGEARRTFDYGRLRLTYDRVHGTVRDAEEARRMASWGPGRADVTEDDDEDPVTIPDLWGIRAQAWLAQAGTIRHASPSALAIRQDTQLIDSNHARIRPPRELAWALAMFVYSLTPPPAVPPTPTIASTSSRGAALFAKHCRECHRNAAHGGRLISATTIGTDPALATGGGRGTGRYRVPPLLAVARGAPYLHDGSVSSLEELLSPARLAGSYAAGRFGPGPIPGHRAGTGLGDDERAALLAFLATL